MFKAKLVSPIALRMAKFHRVFSVPSAKESKTCFDGGSRIISHLFFLAPCREL